MVRQKVFSERLTELMNRYTNQQLTAAEVLAELAAIARDLVTTMRSNVRVDWSRREDVRACETPAPRLCGERWRLDRRLAGRRDQLRHGRAGEQLLALIRG